MPAIKYLGENYPNNSAFICDEMGVDTLFAYGWCRQSVNLLSLRVDVKDYE